ncbi:MAG: hypothetical protein ACRCX2_35670 [Paraclostridium sp.]
MWIYKEDKALNTKNMVMLFLTKKEDGVFLSISFGSTEELDLKIKLLNEEKPTMEEIVKRLKFLEKEHDYLDLEDFKKEMEI